MTNTQMTFMIIGYVACTGVACVAAVYAVKAVYGVREFILNTVAQLASIHRYVQENSYTFNQAYDYLRRMEGRLTEKIELYRAEVEQTRRELSDKDERKQSLRESCSSIARQVGELMTRYQYLHACWEENNADLDHIKEYLRKAENRILELEQWDVDAHDKLCEIGNMLKAQQNWNEKIGTFMADIGQQVYKLNKESRKVKCTKSKNS